MKTMLFLALLGGNLLASNLGFRLHSEDFPATGLEHPFSGKVYQKMAIGKSYKTSSWRNRYLNRIVTLYNVEKKAEPLPNAPAIHESCHDTGNRFASWSQNETLFRSFDAGVDFDLLGLGFNIGGEYGNEISFSFERWVIARENIEAVHRPMIAYEIYEGESYRQTINLRTGESYNSPIDRPHFHADYMNPVLKVRREVIQECK